MNRAYLLIGGNVGDTAKYLAKAVSEIENRIGKVLKKSSLYATEAWGKEDQRDFLNQAILVETKHPPPDLLNELLEIEKALGRIRSGKKWEERIVDIDILFYINRQELTAGEKGEALISDSKNLKIPHPYLHLRRFTLEPMNEIAAGLVHPVFNKTISALLEECPDKLKVRKLV